MERTIVVVVREDDLCGAAVRDLVNDHVREMFAVSPASCVNALGVEALQRPDITAFTAWCGDDIAGCGALRALSAGVGEVKSMRVADCFRGRGVGRALLTHIINEARARGYRDLMLETGSSDAFAPALRLYVSAGFVRCPAFGDYVNGDTSFAIYMALAL